MNIYCELCGKVSEVRELTCCCWKTICRDHKYNTCPICEGLGNRLTYLIDSCERCNNKEISVSCIECNAILCTQCSDQIHCKGKLRLHKIQEIHIASDHKCAVHSLPIEYYCSECKLTCILCSCKHDKITLNAPPQSLSRELADLTSEVAEKTRALLIAQEKCTNQYNNYSEYIQDLKHQVSIEFSRIKFQLTSREEEIINEINQISKDCLKTIQNKINIMKKLLDNLSIASKVLASARFNSFDLFLQSKTSLTCLLSETNSFTNNPTESTDDHTLQFLLPPNQSFIESISLKKKKPEAHKSPTKLSPQNPTSPSKLPSRPSHNHRSASTSSLLKDMSLQKLEPILIQELPPRPTPIAARKSLPANARTSDKSNTPRPVPPKKSKFVENPLFKKSFTTVLQSLHAIKLAWTHPPEINYMDLEYGLECSLDGNMFNMVYQGELSTCIITELIEDKEYYFRVTPRIGMKIGETSDAICVKTLGFQEISKASLGNHAVLENKAIVFKSHGIVYGEYPWTFGKHCWEVKICNNASTTGFLKIGVVGSDKKNLVGKSVIFGKNDVCVRIFLDIEEGFLIFTDSATSEDLVKIPQDPSYYPAIQYKSSKNLPPNVTLFITFDIPH